MIISEFNTITFDFNGSNKKEDSFKDHFVNCNSILLKFVFESLQSHSEVFITNSIRESSLECEITLENCLDKGHRLFSDIYEKSISMNFDAITLYLSGSKIEVEVVIDPILTYVKPNSCSYIPKDISYLGVLSRLHKLAFSLWKRR